MIAWRVCRTVHADLTGDGARTFGGRWNSPGQPLVYMASSAALAVLEIRVHLDLPPDLLPDDYVLLSIDFGDIPVEEVSIIPANPQQFGDIWLHERRTPVLQVPSAIVTESTNLLLNPLHPLAKTATIVTQRPFAFDARLWLRAASRT